MTAKVSRREFIKLASVSGFLTLLPKKLSDVNSLSFGARDWITTGHVVPELIGFDNTMRDFMQARNIPRP